MNVISRGVRNALRSPLKSGAIILMLAVSIGLVLTMLVARTSVNAKITEVKSTTTTGITVSPAGVQGGTGGGDALTSDQIKTIAATAHIKTVSSTLTDQLGATDTNLTSSLALGNFGKRQMRFEQGQDSGPGASGTTPSIRKMSTPRTSVIGTNSPSSIITSDKLTSGSTIDGKTDCTFTLKDGMLVASKK